MEQPEVSAIADNGDHPLADLPHYDAESIEASRSAILLFFNEQARRIMRAVGDDLATHEQVASMAEIAAAFERAHHTEQ